MSIEWKETSGRKVGPPGKHGFGSTLIERSIPGAKVEREFRPEGVVYKLELRLGGANAHGSTE